MIKYGLIGNPIAHSKSPELFKAAYQGKFNYSLIETADFKSSYNTFIEEYQGINVTSPYKGDACACAPILSHACIVTGAANTLVKTEKGIKAYNTDVDGVRACIAQSMDKTASKYGTHRKALIVGCGGAGKAAAFAAALEEFELIILNRNTLKAEVYARKLMNMGKTPLGSIHTGGLEELRKWFKEVDLLIWTLPLKTSELDLLESELDQDTIHCPSCIIEANYRDPAFTKTLAEKIKAKGTVICPGERWLLHQGVISYKIFTGEEPDIEAMAKVL